MLIAISEINSWEREKWTYVLDIDKQDGEVLNNLMIFIRVANKHFDEVKETSPNKFFTASRYSYKFYNSIDLTHKHPRLINKNSSLIIASDPGYNSHSFDLDLVISRQRMKSAMIRMRDKQINDLYKNFDGLFLKKKSKALTDK